MVNNQKIKEFALIYLIAIILLIGTVAFFNFMDPSITGFAVHDNETTINETQSDEDIKVIDLSERVNETNETTVTNEIRCC